MFKEPEPYRARGHLHVIYTSPVPRLPAGCHIFSQWALGPCVLCLSIHPENSALRCCPLPAGEVEVVPKKKAKAVFPLS